MDGDYSLDLTALQFGVKLSLKYVQAELETAMVQFQNQKTHHAWT